MQCTDTHAPCPLWLRRYWYYASKPLSLSFFAPSATSSVGTGAAATAVVSGGSLQSRTSLTKQVDVGSCEAQLDAMRSRLHWQAEELQRVRHKCLPGF